MRGLLIRIVVVLCSTHLLDLMISMTMMMMAMSMVTMMRKKTKKIKF